MQRRDFLLASLLLPLFAQESLATPTISRQPYRVIPGWMKVFFERYWKFHNQNFFDHSRVWPKDLVKGLFDQIGEPRDFCQSISRGKLIPQFQWVYDIVDAQVTSSTIEWYDIDDSARFRSLIRKHFPYLPNGDWCGITWNPVNDSIACHSLVNEITELKLQGPLNLYDNLTIHSQFFENKKKSYVESSAFQKVGSTLEIYRNGSLEFIRLYNLENPIYIGLPRTVKLRRQIYKEFRILESSIAMSDDGLKQRLYFP